MYMCHICVHMNIKIHIHSLIHAKKKHCISIARKIEKKTISGRASRVMQFAKYAYVHKRNKSAMYIHHKKKNETNLQASEQAN